MNNPKLLIICLVQLIYNPTFYYLLSHFIFCIKFLFLICTHVWLLRKSCHRKEALKYTHAKCKPLALYLKGLNLLDMSCKTHVLHNPIRDTI